MGTKSRSEYPGDIISTESPRTPTSFTKKASSHGKLILTGEHSAVFDRPALAIPIQDYSVSVKISDTKHTDWIRQAHPLVSLTLSKSGLIDYFNKNHNQQIFIDTNLPAGIGLGASSALVAALIHLQENVEGEKRPFSDKLALAKECEDLAHGRSSGLDVAVALLQKPITFHSGEVGDAPAGIDQSYVLINTGIPESTTRDCVHKVGSVFKKDDHIWNDFENIFDEIIKNGLSIPAVRENHDLLERIGVVPDYISGFIQDIENMGGAAKISGAGNIKSDSKSAGIVMVIGLDKKPLKDLSEKHGYNILPR